MNAMRRATTYAHMITVKGFPMELMNSILVTYSQGGRIVLEKTRDEVDIIENTICVSITQREAIRFREGSVQIQLRFTSTSGDAFASPIYTDTVRAVLNDEVLE